MKELYNLSGTNTVVDWSELESQIAMVGSHNDHVAGINRFPNPILFQRGSLNVVIYLYV